MTKHHGDTATRRQIILGAAGLALGISGCHIRISDKKSNQQKKVTLDKCPDLKSYIESMCNIREGTFLMGSKDQKRDDEFPEHRVAISACLMGKTPVTVSMWEEFCNHSNKLMPPNPSPSFNYVASFNVGWKLKDHPIVGISWNECQQFASWASSVSGVKLNLPSEALYEYACRGAKEGLDYPWGNEFDRTKLWCSKYKLGDKGSTGSVNRSNDIWFEHPWHLLDLVGNVDEWCQDWYDPDWYLKTNSRLKDSMNDDPSFLMALEYPDKPSKRLPVRCVRGGSWADDEPEEFRISKRYWMEPNESNVTTGFRLSAPVE